MAANIYTAEFIIKQVVEVIIGVISVLGNSLVLYTIYKYNNLKTITNYLIASLAAADLMVGMIGIPIVIVNNLGIPKHFYGCLFTNCVIIIFTQISVFSLVGIAVERFIAVKYAILHRHHVTTRVVLLLVLICWVSGTIVGSVPMFGWHSAPLDLEFCSFILVIDMKYMVYFNFFGFILVPLVIIFATYIKLFQFIWSRSRKVRESNALPDDNVKIVKLRKESRAAKKIFLVIVLFTLCWLPIHIINTIMLLTGKFNIHAMTIGVYLSHINSMINPFFYANANPRFKEAFKRTLRLTIDNASMGQSLMNDTTIWLHFRIFLYTNWFKTKL